MVTFENICTFYALENLGLEPLAITQNANEEDDEENERDDEPMSSEEDQV